MRDNIAKQNILSRVFLALVLISATLTGSALFVSASHAQTYNDTGEQPATAGNATSQTTPSQQQQPQTTDVEAMPPYDLAGQISSVQTGENGSAQWEQSGIFVLRLSPQPIGATNDTINNNDQNATGNNQNQTQATGTSPTLGEPTAPLGRYFPEPVEEFGEAIAEGADVLEPDGTDDIEPDVTPQEGELAESDVEAPTGNVETEGPTGDRSATQPDIVEQLRSNGNQTGQQQGADGFPRTDELDQFIQFVASFDMYRPDGSELHNHEVYDFRLTGNYLAEQVEGQWAYTFTGEATVTMPDKVVEQVPTIIQIQGNSDVQILLGGEVEEHFNEQPINALLSEISQEELNKIEQAAADNNNNIP